LQLRVLRFRSDEDGYVRVCVFPEREEILICRLGFGGVTLQGISACETEMGECSGEMVADNSAMVKDFLELDGSFAVLTCG
jgi:hypothetical protein